ncbi:MAG TPA: hypothetical protein VHL78_04535 [Actinomycetota bacterium]|nr:hypothetical protein [Actinomycetota bacterium]
MIARLHRDERGIIVPFFLKLILSLAIIGIATVETTAVIFARFQAQDIAETAANVAAGSIQSNGSIRDARRAARQAVKDKDRDAKLASPFVVHRDGRVTVTVRVPASTLVIQHIGFLDGFTVARGRAVGRPSPV